MLALQKRKHRSRGLELQPLGIYEATIVQWPTPNPLELIFAIKQENDPDAIAELVEEFRFGYGRYGEWSSLPAPLFLERAVPDYIAEFNNEEEAEEENAQKKEAGFELRV